MPSAKILSASWLVLFNFHVGIAKSNDFFFAILACFNNKFLTTRNLTLGLVTSHLRFINLCHSLPQVRGGHRSAKPDPPPNRL
tara:strand:- start:549 stop:797 length:249 start_codon:yes stop_codon:yes gene_type:complete